MRLSRLLIENYRNFRRLEISELPARAVIVGENGVGKSNLLRALRLVLDPDLPDSARFLREEDICDHSASTLARGVEVKIEIELTDFDADEGAMAELDGCIVGTEPLTARITYLFRPVEALAPGVTMTRDDYTFLIYGGGSERSDARRIRRSIALSVLGALRDAEGDLDRPRRSPLRDLLDAAPPSGQMLEKAAKTISTAMDELAKDENVVALAGDLGERLRSMAGPRLEADPTLGFASSAPSELLTSVKLFIDAERRRGVADTSTGYANVVYLALLLERVKMRRLRDHVVDTVLAVEEPEAHLHPVLQRHLFRYLLRDPSPMLLTTNSTHIAAVAPLESLVLLRADNKGTVATLSPAALSKNDRADLERYLDVSRAEALFCSGMILVEGIAEVYLLPLLGKLMGFDIESYGVVVGSVAGTDFMPYRKLLGTSGFRIPHVVMTDGDRLKRGGYLGLRRAAGLLTTAADQELLRSHVLRLCQTIDEHLESPADEDGEPAVPAPSPGEDPGPVSEADALLLASRSDIYVGHDTLELDLASLLADEMVAAYQSFSPTTNLATKFASALYAVGKGGASELQRAEVLRRIEDIGKGRYAQRLADVLASSAPGVLEDKISRWIDDTDTGSTAEIGTLLASRPYAFIFVALDRMALQVRGLGLFEGCSKATQRVDA